MECFDSDGKAVKINIGPLIDNPCKELVMPIIRQSFPQTPINEIFAKQPLQEHALYDDSMKTPPIDTTRLAAALDKLQQAAKESGEVIVAATRTLFENLPLLSDEEIEIAKRLEDLIEDTLEKEYDTKDPTKEIFVPAAGVDAAIIKWLSKRYPAWDMVYIKGQFRMVPHDCRKQEVQ